MVGKKFADLTGLKVKDGRLINDREQSEMGIQKAARLRRELKSSHKVRDIAAGIELAEQQKEIREVFTNNFFNKK